jgi:hypothetical protein
MVVLSWGFRRAPAGRPPIRRRGRAGLRAYITAPSCQGTNSFWP